MRSPGRARPTGPSDRADDLLVPRSGDRPGDGGGSGSGGPGGSGGSGDPERPGGPGDPGGGRVAPTGHGALAALLAVGLVGGWLLRPVALRAGFVEPRVGWGTIGLLLFLAASVAATAWVTRRTVRRDRAALPHHTAVNRLALGKACSLVGAVLAGGYSGYAVAQLGLSDPTAASRLLHSGAAAVASALLIAAALWLEHACRVPGGPGDRGGSDDDRTSPRP